jgi:hypothetical protein
MQIDGNDIFSAGACRLSVGSWNREQIRRPLSGLDGELVIDQGLRSRTLTVTGRLTGATASLVASAAEAIAQLCDGQSHTLTDNNGRVFERVLVEAFEPGVIQLGRAWCCDFTLELRQLP